MGDRFAGSLPFIQMLFPATRGVTHKAISQYAAIVAFQAKYLKTLVGGDGLEPPTSCV
jgi:hypothetical protein